MLSPEEIRDLSTKSNNSGDVGYTGGKSGYIIMDNKKKKKKEDNENTDVVGSSSSSSNSSDNSSSPNNDDDNTRDKTIQPLPPIIAVTPITEGQANEPLRGHMAGLPCLN